MSVIPFSLLMNADIEKISMKVDLAEERDGVVKYRVRVVLDSNEYIIYREYKQFKAFYKSLRTKFTRLEFSDFPSKFAVFNKKEQRRKGFDSFLRNLLEIGGNFASLAQSTLKRLLCDFLIEGKPGVITETDEIVEGEQVKANLGSMMGFVDIKFDDEDWISYYASLIKSDIYFFANDNDSYFTMMINCSGAEISESDFEDVLEIHHLHEKRPILIRAKNWLDWKHALVVVSGYAVASKYHKNKSNGRLVIRIYSGQNIRLMKPAVSIVKPHVFVKITLDSLEYQTSIMPQEYLVNWNQTFIL